MEKFVRTGSVPSLYPALHWCYHQQQTGSVPSLYPALHWCYHQQQTGSVPSLYQALHWCYHQQQTGSVPSLYPALHWCYQQQQTGSVPSLYPALHWGYQQQRDKIMGVIGENRIGSASPRSPMEDKENQLERDHTLVVVLPGGQEKTTTVHGSKPVMDLLVTLCARYHLNPSEHHVDLLSPNSNQITFKPNSPIGSLEAERIVLKPKESEEKVKKTYIPEATVRLLINYRKSHKTVVRVNPRVPLENLLPAICQKCELDMESTILLRDSSSQEPLDLSKSLNGHGVREVFAKDTAAVSLTDVAPSPTQEDVEDTDLPNNEDKAPKKQKEKENKGFFSLFKRRKNKSEKGASVSAPVSPGLSQRAVNTLATHTSNTLPLDAPKKRRAPLPPMAASFSVPANLNGSHPGSRPLDSPEGQAVGLSRVSSTESCLRTKRRAPPPPGTTPHHAHAPDSVSPEEGK
ncbi:cordon-bleu protein-like 1 [Osmerus mordax]|uniref:cordon-bleu protein-like 1 n=1 Tax=Osmerus mordax TaxID=8014 RepID=UPI00350EBE62